MKVGMKVIHQMLNNHHRLPKIRRKMMDMGKGKDEKGFSVASRSQKLKDHIDVLITSRYLSCHLCFMFLDSSLLPRLFIFYL